jgi:excisionase family DNA binding protein
MVALISANVKRNSEREVARMETRLVTLERAAEELQVSRDTLRRLAASGQLKIVRISRHVLVPTSEIARIAESGAGKYAGRKAAKASV